jgi:hypothetical protein
VHRGHYGFELGLVRADESRRIDGFGQVPQQPVGEAARGLQVAAEDHLGAQVTYALKGSAQPRGVGNL